MDEGVQSDSSSVASSSSHVFEEKFEALLEEPHGKPMSKHNRLTSIYSKQDSRKWRHTLAVVLHSITFLTASLTVIFLFIPSLRPLLLIYLIHIYLSSAGQSGNLSNRSSILRSLPIWDAFASYFPAALHRIVPLDPTQTYIFGYSPHGIICHGAFSAFCTEALGFSTLFPGITNTLVFIDFNLRLPFYREYALRMGFRGVSKASCRNVLEGGPGRAITIAVGGARESLLARPGTMRLVINQRDGFVKLAIETGAHLVPVLAFGENDLYGQLDAASHPRIRRLQELMKEVLGWTLPLFYGKGVFGGRWGFLAFPRPLNIVVGKPIMVTQQKLPDPAYVREVHAAYLEGLRGLWEEFKDEFAPGRTGELEFI